MYIVLRSRIWRVLCDPAIDIKFHKSHKLQHHTWIDKLYLKVYLHIPRVIHPKNTTLQHMDLICFADKERTVKKCSPFICTHLPCRISLFNHTWWTFHSWKFSTWFWKNLSIHGRCQLDFEKTFHFVRFKFSNIMHLNVNNFPQTLPGFQTQLRMLRLYIDSAKHYVGPGSS
jgi:hypothetical protein